MIRNKFANKFTQISNAVLNDKELSLEEKGLFCYLFSKPDCWEFHYNVMRKELSEKSDKTIRKVLNRLVEKGYITKTQVSGENGQFGGIDIEFTDKAFSVTEGKNTDAANLPVGKNGESANLPSNNTNNINNTDITTNTKKDLLGEEEKEPKRFVKPTIEEIEAYCKEKGISINARKFYYHYDARGWMMGKTKMKRWKSAVNTWVDSPYNTERKQTVAEEFLSLGQEE